MQKPTESSCFEITQAENGFNTYDPGLKTVSADLSGFYRQTNNFFDILATNEIVIIDIDWEGDGQTVSRGIFVLVNTDQSGDVGAQEEYSASFNLFVPVDVLPFSWYFGPATKAPEGMRRIIEAWQNRQDLYVRYYPKGDDTGNTYYKGQGVVTDCSVSTAVSGIGEVTLGLTGNGELERLTA